MSFRYLACLYLLAVVWLLSSVASPAKADVVSEFGMGIKMYNDLFSTSYVLQPDCSRVWVNKSWPTDCGGNNPAFIGWPIAWESDWKGEYGAWRVRVGWFHYSNWFDGGEFTLGSGDDSESQMDALAATATFNWSHFFRRK